MKKLSIVFSALAALLLAGSCQREEFRPVGNGAVTFTVTVPGSMNTKAIADGMNVDEVHYAVYKTDDAEEYSVNNGAGPLAQGVVEMENKTATVSLDLLQDQNYTIIFWAQVKDAGHYDLGDLRQITATNLTTASNDESRAAFYAKKEFDTKDSQTHEVVLTRPFAQLNLGTSFASLEPTLPGQNNSYQIKVEESAVTVKNVSNVFNTVTGAAVEGELTYSFESAPTPAQSGEELKIKIGDKEEEYHYVAMNYVFVPSNDKLVEISYDITTDKGEVNNTIINVPLKKNYRTNIIGNLLTSKTSFDIIVDERFEEDKGADPIPPIYVWGGEVKEPALKDGVYEIWQPAELAWMAAAVNASAVQVKSSAAVDLSTAKFKLMADIDLQNHLWVPIGANEDNIDNYKIGEFDGNGKTISNLKVDRQSGAGLFGFLGDGDILNVTIDGFDIKSNCLSGAIVGSGKNISIRDCSVKNGVISVAVNEVGDGIYANGDKVGAVAGYICDESEVKSNSVSDVTLTAYAYCGGVVGYAESIESVESVSGNTIESVVFVQNTENGYEEEVPDTFADYVGNSGEVTESAKNTHIADGVSEDEDGNYCISSAAGMKWFYDQMIAQNTFKGVTIKLTQNIDMSGIEWDSHSENGKTVFYGIFDGNSKTISNFTATAGKEGGYATMFEFFGGEVKNVTFEGVTATDNNTGGRASVIAGYTYSSKLSGITVRNAVITGYQKLSVLVSNLPEKGSELQIENCHIQNVTFKSNSDGPIYHSGAIIGYTFNYKSIEVTDCSVSNIIFDHPMTVAECGDTPHYPYYCHPFIASLDFPMVNDKDPIDGTVRLLNNKISGNNTKTDVCRTGSSEYFGYSAVEGTEFRNNPRLTIFIDGQKYASEVIIANAEDLKWFAGEVNEGDNFSKKTVNLTADIDLANEPWTPIGNSTNNFQGTFDGQNHTISNLLISAEGKSDIGLFGCTTEGEIKNLTVKNAKVTGRVNVGVIAGTPYTSKYTNIKVTGHVEVKGLSYVGGVGGKNAYADWTNVTVDVDNSSYVKANSVENGTAYRTYVGGVVGFNGEGGHSFTNITSNIDVIGSTQDVGGLFGIAHYGNKFINCSCSGDVTITGDSEEAEALEIGGIAGVWHNESGYTVTMDKCSFTGTLNTNIPVTFMYDGLVGKPYSSNEAFGVLKIDGAAYAYVKDAAKLTEVLAAPGGTAILQNDVNTEAATVAPYGNKYAFKMDGGVLDGQGHKLEMECYGDDYGIMTSGGTVKNLTIEEGCRAIMIMYPQSDIILDKVNIGGGGVLYPINTGEPGADGVKLIVTNSVIAGWTSFQYLESASFTNVDFKQGTYYNNIYGRVLKPYVNTVLTDCSFIEHMNLDLSELTKGHKVTFKNCKVAGKDVNASVFTVPTTDAQYDTELFTVDLPEWATGITDCAVFE